MTDSLMTYSAVSGIAMALLYAVYHFTMRHTTLFSFNRHTLVAILIFSALVPLTSISKGVSTAIGHAGIALPELEISLTGVDTPQAADSMSFFDILSVIYIAGFAIAAARMACNIVFIAYISLTSRKAEIGGTKVRLHRHKRLSPFCWGDMIFIPEAMLGDDEKELAMMIAHETSHRRHMHWVDLLLANAMAVIDWYNPCSWLIIHELVNMHEYEADRDTVKGCDDPVEYQLLLIKKTAGSRFHAFADSLNHSSLKKRITMMMKNQSKSSARLRALAMLPAVAAALCLTNVSCVKETSEKPAEEVVTEVTETTNPENAVQDNSGDAQLEETVVVAYGSNDDAPAGPAPTISKMPVYPGGESALYGHLASTINFVGDEGLVVVGFTIDKEGNLVNPHIVTGLTEASNKEALRCLETMDQKWTPAVNEKGETVDCSYTLPIRFKIAK